jgi:hypothetical protein
MALTDLLSGTLGAGISGQGGNVFRLDGEAPFEIYEVKKWSFKAKGTTPGYRSNKTGGFTKRVAGYMEASGTVEGVYDPAKPVTLDFDVTDSVVLYLQTEPGQGYVVQAIIDGLNMDVDIESGEPVSWSMDFSNDGMWLNPTAWAPVLAANPDELPGGRGQGLLAAVTRASGQSDAPKADAPPGEMPHASAVENPSQEPPKPGPQEGPQQARQGVAGNTWPRDARGPQEGARGQQGGLSEADVERVTRAVLAALKSA